MCRSVKKWRGVRGGVKRGGVECGSMWRNGEGHASCVLSSASLQKILAPSI